MVAKDEALRRNGEHDLCEQVTSTPCVPAFAVVPDGEFGDVAKVKERVDAGGFDGAVVMRLVGRRVRQTYVLPPPTPMWGFDSASWPMAYDAGYVRQDELLDVETCIYSVKEGRLLWAGTTESTNPSDVRRTVKEIADAVAAKRSSILQQVASTTGRRRTRCDGRADPSSVATGVTWKRPLHAARIWFNATANGSQIRVDMRAPSMPGNFRLYYQNDFLGDDQKQIRYRLQHLYGQYPDSWPDTVAFSRRTSCSPPVLRGTMVVPGN